MSTFMKTMRHCLIAFISLVQIGVGVGAAHGQVVPIAATVPKKGIIDFHAPDSLDQHRPIIIAHRGGVITKASPECSLAAIGLAAQQGYDMVELDVRASKDGVPVVFHDASLVKACGRYGRVDQYAADELNSFTYLGSDERIVRLESALRLCRAQHLGVMLDLKFGRDNQTFLRQLHHLLEKHDLLRSTITFSSGKDAREILTDVRFTPTDKEMQLLRNGAEVDLRSRFWFGLPRQLQDGDIERLTRAGATILPAINTFRYPADRHRQLAKDDILSLTKAGVHGFQLDSIYFDLVPKSESTKNVK